MFPFLFIVQEAGNLKAKDKRQCRLAQQGGVKIRLKKASLLQAYPQQAH